jgi:uncharacterized membrane protein
VLMGTLTTLTTLAMLVMLTTDEATLTTVEAILVTVFMISFLSSIALISMIVSGFWYEAFDVYKKIYSQSGYPNGVFIKAGFL